MSDATGMITQDHAGPAARALRSAADYRSLDELAAHWARQRPEALAIADSPNRGPLGLGPPRRFTFGAADAVISRLSRCFSELGLEPGERVAIQLPNIAELPLVTLAAMRAGLAASPLPVMWRRRELAHAFSRLRPSAVITGGVSGGRARLEIMRQAAEGQAALRLLLGFGEALPAGVSDLGKALDDAADDNAGAGAEASADRGAEDARRPAGLDHPGLLSWGFDRQAGLIAIPRSRRELIASGLMPVLQMGLTSHDVLLSPYSLTGLTGLAGTLVPWLITGSALILHHPFDFEIFLRQLAEENITCTAAPAPVIQEMKKSGVFDRTEIALQRIAMVWPAPHVSAKAATLPDAPVSLYYMQNLREFALIVRPASGDEDPGALPLGVVTAPAPSGAALALLETRVRGKPVKGGENTPVLSGELCLRGPSLPSSAEEFAALNGGARLMQDQEGFINTGIPCAVGDAAMTSLILRPDPGLVCHGGLLLDIEELDRLYADFPDFLDAAAFTIDDPVMGQRIFAAVVPPPGAAPREREFREYLHNLEIAPFKIPEKLVAVTIIPRDAQGRVLRGQILDQI